MLASPVRKWRMLVMVGTKMELPMTSTAITASLAVLRRELVVLLKLGPRWLVDGESWTETS